MFTRNRQILRGRTVGNFYRRSKQQKTTTYPVRHSIVAADIIRRPVGAVGGLHASDSGKHLIATDRPKEQQTDGQTDAQGMTVPTGQAATEIKREQKKNGRRP